MNFNDEAFRSAWRKVLRSRDGAALRQSLMLVTMENGPIESGALQQHEGRRSFAAELLRLSGLDVFGNEMPVTAKSDKPERMPNRRIAAEAPRE